MSEPEFPTLREKIAWRTEQIAKRHAQYERGAAKAFKAGQIASDVEFNRVVGEAIGAGLDAASKAAAKAGVHLAVAEALALDGLISLEAFVQERKKPCPPVRVTTPGRSSFALWAKLHAGFERARGRGGVRRQVTEFESSEAVKIAFARAYAGFIREHLGIDASAVPYGCTIESGQAAAESEGAIRYWTEQELDDEFEVTARTHSSVEVKRRTDGKISTLQFNPDQHPRLYHDWGDMKVHDLGVLPSVVVTPLVSVCGQKWTTGEMVATLRSSVSLVPVGLWSSVAGVMGSWAASNSTWSCGAGLMGRNSNAGNARSRISAGRRRNDAYS